MAGLSIPVRLALCLSALCVLGVREYSHLDVKTRIRTILDGFSHY